MAVERAKLFNASSNSGKSTCIHEWNVILLGKKLEKMLEWLIYCHILNEWRHKFFSTWSHCTDSSWPKLYAHKHAVCKSGTSLCHGHWACVESTITRNKHIKLNPRILVNCNKNWKEIKKKIKKID